MKTIIAQTEHAQHTEYPDAFGKTCKFCGKPVHHTLAPRAAGSIISVEIAL